MNHRDQQLIDFEENGERCNVIPMRDFESSFSEVFENDSETFIEFMDKRTPVASIFDSADDVADLGPDIRRVIKSNGEEAKPLNADGRMAAIHRAVKKTKGEGE